MRLTLQLALRALACLAIGLVTLELCARTEDAVRHHASFTGDYSLDSLFTTDAMGKFGLPGSSYLKWHMNELGYRGPALRLGTSRIACIGSSETFGLYEAPEQEWPRQLEAILNQRTGSDRYEVVNVAYPGLSLGTTLRRLPQMLANVRPKVVVIYPSYTSYIENDTPQPWPPAPLGNAPPPPPAHFSPRIASRLDTFSKSTLPEWVQNDMRAWQMRRSVPREGVSAVLPERNIQAFATDLDRIVTELRSRGVDVILVTHANRFGAHLDPAERPVLTAWRKFYPTLTEEGLLDMERRMSEQVRAIGAKENVPVLDAATQIPPGSKNFAEFVHFTSAGANALATLVADEIQHDQRQGVFSTPNR